MCHRRSGFNPRARAGRDSNGLRTPDEAAVSIHAPARGATHHPRCQRSLGIVSIHAPARGATLLAFASGPAYGFQSTRPRGARLEYVESVGPNGEVSIHAPARGATWSICALPVSTWSFNPRARAGRDKINGITDIAYSGFQSTRPRGARLCTEATLLRVSVFQSTRPRGARQFHIQLTEIKG